MTALHMGINMGHDRSVAVVRDGQLVVAIEQERLDRIKHSVGFMYQAPSDMSLMQVPGECIRYCLDALGVPLREIATITANMPGTDHGPDILRAKFSADIAANVRQVPSHHLAHAYSAWWPSGFDEAIVIAVDATGSTYRDPNGRSTESYSVYVARGDELELLHSERVQAQLAGLSTLGFVYEYVTRHSGFITQVGSALRFPEAGKLMGLAAYGGPQENLHPWLQTEPGSYSLGISAYDIFLEVEAFKKAWDSGEGRPYLRPWVVDLAWKVQKELEDAMTHLVRTAVEATGIKKLCLAGGVALNSVANYQVYRRLELEDVFVFPAAADNGIAAGCALWAYHQLEGGTKRPTLEAATLGRSYSVDEIDAALDDFAELVEGSALDDKALVQRTATALAAGHVVARFEGGAEYGPRALGHRSILADPTFERMKDVLNARVKFREAFRPFAPVIPRERVSEVFELAVDSPFMLLVSAVRSEFHAQLPAITHEDGTGRVQTCTAEANPFFHALCNAAADTRGGPPVILNTSFNVAGQPIVETPAEAIQTFLNTDIDYLALGPYWIVKKHVAVSDYSTHLSRVTDSSLPRGLPAGVDGVNELMAQLDRALFFGEKGGPWSSSELCALSAEGARYKETSRLFPETPFHGELSTRLAPDLVLLLDPLGRSVLIEEEGRIRECRYDLGEVKLLVAAQADPQEAAESLRLDLQLTHQELESKMEWACGELRRFGGATHPGWSREAWTDSPLPKGGEGSATFAAFEDPDFEARESLRDLAMRLVQHGYTEDALVDLLEVESLQQIEPTHLHYLAELKLPATPLADLARLFQLRASLTRARVEELFGRELTERVLGLGLLEARDGELSSRVDLFCSGSLLLATDHRFMIRAEDSLEEDPVMYIGMDSHGLVQAAPRNRRADRTLDLCCGSGIQGLIASRYSKEVIAVDINPRALRFSRFNAQLNGIENYRVELGSLYDGLDGQLFDVILANPPFVPSPSTDTRFRDGGCNGEEVLSAIVRGAPAHLSSEGHLAIVTDLVDIESYESKLSGWWGESPSDRLLLVTADRDELLFSVPHSHAPFSQSLEDYNRELARWVENFRGAGLRAVNFGYILVWRRESAGGEFHVRTINNPATPIHDRLEAWHRQLRLLESHESHELFLQLHPDLCFREERSASGEALHCELTVPGDPFFTTYVVAEPLLRELRTIHAAQPRLGNRLSRRDERWIMDLLRKGLLVLSPRPRERSLSRSLSSEAELTVEELQTKTTPTCLTSYLS